MLFFYLVEKKERLKVSLPAEAQNDLAVVAAKKRSSSSALVRELVLDFLRSETGKNYDALQWGGYRAGAGRKSTQSDPPRHPVPADGEIKPRSRNAAAAGTKKRRSSVA